MNSFYSVKTREFAALREIFLSSIRQRRTTPALIELKCLLRIRTYPSS